MKTLLIFCILLISLQLFSQEEVGHELGVACTSPDSRCFGYDLDVNASVLKVIQFNQLQPLNLGKVTKGETVTVSDNDTEQTRDRSFGRIDISFRSLSEGIRIKCLADQSKVNFGMNEGDGSQIVYFSSCSMDGEKMAMYASGNNEPITENERISDNEIFISQIFDYVLLRIGGGITVPNSENVTNGAKTGSMRIEITYL